jgi:hypothetical protein
MLEDQCRSVEVTPQVVLVVLQQLLLVPDSLVVTWLYRPVPRILLDRPAESVSLVE